jgi:hypothetical protein
MSSSVASVEFKAVGQQQVVSAFKSVGDSAATSATKVQQNSNAMKTVGQGMKNSVSGIGQVTTAFATLSLSIVSTWRSYRDLHSQQLDIDKMNTKIAKAEQSLKLDRDKLTAATKAASKGGLEYKGHQLDIANAEAVLKKAIKDHGKNSLQAATAQQKLNEVIASGSKGTKEMADLEAKIALKEEGLANMKGTLKEKQKSYNDTIQDFYLSIAPLAISTIATLSTAFSGLKGALTGGIGLTGFGGIGLILAGITVAIIAFKTNFLGLRDAVGGVIDWIKERFGLWKDTIEKVFNLIKGGKWGEAFNMIKEAAAAFWADLVKTVPFFGTVSDIVEKIKNGKWADAFNIIATAAAKMWEDLKKQVPFFAGAEVFLKQLFGGDLSGAFNTLAAGIKTGLETIFGKDAVGALQEKIGIMVNTAKNLFSQMSLDMTKPGGPVDLIKQGLAKLGQGDVVGGFGGIAKGIKEALDLANTYFASWVKTNFGIDILNLELQANVIGNKILSGIASGLTVISKTWIDPILTAMLDPQTWIQGFIAMGGFFVKIGTALYTAIGTALGNAAKDPKGAATWWADLGNGIWTGITTWFKANLPGATKAMEAIAQSLVDGVEAAKTQIQNIGIQIWNQIIEGIRAFTGGAASPFGPALDALKKTPIELPVKPIITSEGKTGIETWTKQNPIQLATGINPTGASKGVDTFQKDVARGHYGVGKIPTDADTKNAIQSAKKAAAQIDDMKATINVSPNFIGFGHGAGFGQFQHGYQGTVKRPTAFIAGEGGRPEDVTVRPRGSVQRGGSSGGGGSTHITVSFEPQEFAQFIRYRINDNQGVVK